MNEKALDKIRKLLAVGHSTTNTHEAAAFIARAQALMREYQIDDAALVVEGEGPDEPIEDAYALHITRQKVHWVGDLAVVIAKANGCRTYWQKRWRASGGRHHIQTALRVVGRRSDADAVRYLFTYCRGEIERLADGERTLLRMSHQSVDRTYMRSFREGCVWAIAQAINREQERVDEEMRARSAETCRALVRLDERDGEVSSWMDDNLKLKTARQSQANVAPAGWVRGNEAGRNIYPSRSSRRLGSPAPRLRG